MRQYVSTDYPLNISLPGYRNLVVMDAPATFMEQPAIFVERTLAIIKPDAIEESAKILSFIENHGFGILQVNINK